MNRMDLIEYETVHWPSLREALHLLFTQSPGNRCRFSYEQTYSCVYKCACNHYTSRLLNDFYNEIAAIMKSLNLTLQDKEGVDLLDSFALILQQFLCASKTILLIFGYMSRAKQGIEEELKSKLSVMFRTMVVDVHLRRVIDILEQSERNPFILSPETKSCIISGLYSLQASYSQLAPHIFAHYVPNLDPKLTIDDLPNAIYQTQALQEMLLRNGFTRETSDRKRKGVENDEPAKKSHTSFLPGDSNDNYDHNHLEEFMVT